MGGRRSFFKQALHGASKAVVYGAKIRAEHKASRWIRPPFAKPELEFLLLCTRCDQCVEVCQPQVIFKLSPRTGPEVVATPALDLLNKGCQMCEGWPCVAVCEPKALEIDRDDQGILLPLRLARVHIDRQHCLPYAGPECGACAAACPITGALQWQGPKPTINAEVCSGCALCREVCPTHPNAVVVQPFSLLASKQAMAKPS